MPMMEVEVEVERKQDKTKLTPPLEKYSQYHSPEEENEEDEADFLIFDVNLDCGIQQVSPREGIDLWN